MKKILSLLLLAAILLFPVSCAKEKENAPLCVATLNGTTGFGMAKLMSDAAENNLPYEFHVETDATVVRDALINGSVDIAALPTNVAAAVYNKTEGGIKLLAINTGSVLYLVSKGNSKVGFADLAGKTLYCPAQNPYFITKALLEKAGLLESVTLDCVTYAAPDGLRDALAAGLVDYAILPEPMVTLAKSKATAAGISLTVSVNLQTEWDNYYTPGSLVQGCLAVRTEFYEENKETVEAFMKLYADSVNYVKENPKEAAELIVSAGIFGQATVAQAAIPQCSLCCITGEEMKTAMETFLSAMPAASIGGKLPDGGFYH